MCSKCFSSIASVCSFARSDPSSSSLREDIHCCLQPHSNKVDSGWWYDDSDHIPLILLNRQQIYVYICVNLLTLTSDAVLSFNAAASAASIRPVQTLPAPQSISY